MPQRRPGQPSDLPRSSEDETVTLTPTTPARLEAIFRRNVAHFEKIVARAEAEKSTTLSTWQGCLRSAQKRLECHLEENQDSE